MGAAVRTTVCSQLIAGSIFARRTRRIEPASLLPTASRSAIAGARLALADDPSGDGDRSPSGGNTFKRGASNEDLTRPRNAERVQRALLGIFALLRRAQQNNALNRIRLMLSSTLQVPRPRKGQRQTHRPSARIPEEDLDSRNETNREVISGPLDSR